MSLICTLLQLYIFVIFARIVLSWFPMGYDSPLRSVDRALGTVTDPVLLPLRRTIPAVRLGGMALDLSPLVVIIGISIISGIIC